MYQRENRIPYRHFQQYFGEIPPDGGAIAAKQISRFVRTARCASRLVLNLASPHYFTPLFVVTLDVSKRIGRQH